MVTFSKKQHYTQKWG